MKRWLGLLLAIWLVAPSLAAEEQGEEAVEMEPIVVTAPPIVQSVETDRYGQEKVTVTEDQVEDLNAGDLSASLRRTPGVNISRYNMVGAFGGGDGGAVYIRGMGASRPGAEISIMFDGVPKANSIWVHPLIDTVSADVAGSIDIYRSPQPAYYGNMSYGVINVEPKQMRDDGSLIRLRSGGGTHSTWFFTTEGGYREGPWDLYFVQSQRESAGHREHSYGQVQAYYLGVGYQVNDNVYFSVKGLRTESAADNPGPDTAPPPKRDTFNNTDDMGVVTIATDYDWGEGFVKGFVDRGYNHWREPADDGDTPWQNYGLRAKHTLRLGPVELLGGVDGTYLGGEFIQTDLTGKRIESLPWEIWHLWEPYAGVSVIFGDKDGLYFIPSYAHRWMQHSEFDNKEAWQAGVVAGYDPVEVHANMGRGWNYPGQYTRAYYGMFWSFAYEGDEWEELEPEQIDSWEVGAQVKVKDLAKVNVTYFNLRSEDQIQVIPPPPPPPSLAQVGETEISGVDASLVVTPTDHTAVYAGCARLWPHQPDKISRAPETTVSAGVDVVMADKVKVNVDYQSVSEQYVYNPRNPGDPGDLERIDGYELVNAKVAFLFSAENVSGDVWVAGENLGDEDYEYQPDYPMPGTTWMGGVTLSFR